MDDDNDALPLIHSFDRVAIPAVLIADGGTPHMSGAAGIHEPVVIPVNFGDDATGMLGDGFIPNLTGIFEPEDAEQDDPSEWHLPEPDEA